MELLTGKALVDFNMWVEEYEVAVIEREPSNVYVYYYDLYEEQQLPIIIEWFDSIDIYIEVEKQNSCFSFSIKDYSSVVLYDHYYAIDTRHEATKQAIIHANKIYNER